MISESAVFQALLEQREEVKNFKLHSLCSRFEEQFFEWDSSMAQVVIGVRRSGKSTLCHKVLLEHGVNYGYIDFNDDRLASVKTEDLNVLLGVVYQLYGTDINYLFLDELQDVEGWHLFVNRLLRQGMHIFLTGSNARLLSSELSTYLTGRYNEIRLFPFSFNEVCNYKQIDVKSKTTKADAERKSLFSTYLVEGGFPELSSIRQQQNKRVYIESLIEIIITKDVAKRFKIRNIEGLRRIAHHLINNNCQEIITEQLSEVSNIASPTTLQKYVSYLSQAFLIQPIHKYSYKSRERISKTKSYVIDLGIIANRDNALVGNDLGWRLESAVYIELLRRFHSMADDIYYYKPTTRSKEVDFVVCRQSRVLELIQVAYSLNDEKTLNRELSSLLQASRSLNCTNLTLITLDASRDYHQADITIHICNAVEWFLLPSRQNNL